MEHGLFGWVFLIAAMVLIFGNPKRLSELGRGMGSFLKEFKAAQREGMEALNQESKPASPVVQTQEAPRLQETVPAAAGSETKEPGK